MRKAQFSEFGGPDVLEIIEAPEPHPGPDEIRVVVSAIGVNPADWKMREGYMGGDLPQGTGLEVAGVVDEVGDEVTDVTAGDEVFGLTSGGAADFALLSHYAHIPASLDFAGAAALPMAVETATRVLDLLGVGADQTLLINGASGSVGTAAIQLAVDRGARVIGTASEANLDRLRALGAEATTYGDGLADRVRELAGGRDGRVDRVFDMGPGGALPTLVEIAGGPENVVAIADFAGAQQTGVRTSGGPGDERAWHALHDVTTLVEHGTFTLPVAETFQLDQIADAQRAGQSGQVHGKIVLLVD